MREADIRRAITALERVARVPGGSRELRERLLAEIARHVAFDAYAWVLTDPATEIGSDPLAHVPCSDQLPRLIRLKYATPINRWTGLGGRAVSMHATTRGDLGQLALWRELLAGYAVTDIASSVLRDRFGCWAFLDLWRSGASPPFSEPDLAYLSAVAPTLTAAIRRSQAATFSDPAPVPGPRGPVVLVLSPGLDVRAQSSDTDAQLRALLPPGSGERPVPAGAYNVAAQLLAIEAGVDARPARARVHLPGGGWLSLRAARMAGGEDAIAVTIEAASAGECLDLFSRAHGLTARESEVLFELGRGSDTRALAAGLFVSENTLQDHLKSIFDKTGARSRRALLARALGR